MKVLIRADTTNGHFDALDSEWDEQFRRFDEPSERYQSALLDHARQIAQEEPPSPVYGIFVLYDESAPEGERYAGLVHVNHAFPLTSKPILRMVWVLLAPIYDYQDTDLNEIADITATILHGGLQLCDGKMRSTEMKLHLGNALDRQYALGIARGMKESLPEISAAVRGNWLHLNGVGRVSV